MKYSFIIPVFNRPNEVDELLQSLTTQTLKDFDVLVVEDGSTLPCQDVVARYANQLAIHYITSPTLAQDRHATMACNAPRVNMY